MNQPDLDILIIGAGPAGLAAALAASRSGARVMVFDEQNEMGGSLLAETKATINGESAANWLAAALAELRAASNVTPLSLLRRYVTLFSLVL